MQLPESRGPLSASLFSALKGEPDHGVGDVSLSQQPANVPACLDDDLQIALFVCYALHYRGFDEVDDRWEWNPSLLEVRSQLEQRFERDLTALVAIPEVAPERLPRFLLDVGNPGVAPSLSTHMKREASLEQFREYLVHRSLYNVMEADPHTFAIPRFTGAEKGALLEIQIDEYGGGAVNRMHSTLFCAAMDELGLDSTFGAYVEHVPAISIANLNVISLFALHRRLRGALLGQLAMFEIGSSIVNRRASDGLRRLNQSDRSRWFFDEHVKADAVHEQIAAHDMCGAFVRSFPAEQETVVFGATATAALAELASSMVLDAWQRGETSLRMPLKGESHVG
jgi:hypothetical protein